jgi:hypothetical protein
MESLTCIEPPLTKWTNIYHRAAGVFLGLQTEMVTKDGELGHRMVYEQHPAQDFKFGKVRHCLSQTQLRTLTNSRLSNDLA